MSNTGLSEIDVVSDSVSQGDNVPQSLALPSRLKPVAERNKKVVPKSKLQGIGYQYVREVKNDYNKMENRLFCTQFPLYLQQLESLGLSMEIDMEDQVLCRIANLGKSVEHRVDVVQRLKAIDYLGVGDKTKRTVQEFFTYQKLISAFDKRGSPIGSAYVTVNMDYQVPIRQQYSEDDEPLAPTISGTKFPVYTTLWSKSEFEKVMENQDPSHPVQLIVTNRSASYSGFSLDEFKECSFAELEQRGKTGFVNQPIDDEISKMSKNDRLNLLKSVIPRQ